MDRTPIKIPGKRTRDQSKKALDARKKLNRPPGRPLKLPSKNPTQNVEAASKEPPKKKHRSLKHIKPRRKMSALEKLPTEIIENIYLFCLNLNLPRSSPVLGGKLSSDAVYTATVHAAFGPTWEDTYGHRRLQLSDGLDWVSGDAVLQSSILRCKWAQLPMLLKARDAWAMKNRPGVPFRPIMFNKELDTEMENPAEWKENLKTQTEYFYEDFTVFCETNKVRDASMAEPYSWDGYIHVSGDVGIPESLLIGPWDENMLKHLYWLVKGGARLEWVTSISGEAALIGLRNAISAGNIQAIHLLAWAGLADRIDCEHLSHAIQQSSIDRFAVMTTLFVLTTTPIEEYVKFHLTLRERKEDATLDKNEEELRFLKELMDSPASCFSFNSLLQDNSGSKEES